VTALVVSAELVRAGPLTIEPLKEWADSAALVGVEPAGAVPPSALTETSVLRYW
jgi:hypothetical protein